MDISNIIRNFAAKLMIKFDMNKKIEEKNQSVTPWGYYSALSRGDKSRFMLHLVNKFGFTPRTLQIKLRNADYSPSFSQLEYSAIMDVISSEEWKQ